MEIKDIDGRVLYTCECKTIKECVEDAVKNRVSLCYASLRGADLSNTYLYGADLSHACLYEADLSHSYLTEAVLSHADLYGANLYKADLNFADVCDADLSFANLYDADLGYAKLYGANLHDAKNIPFIPMNLPEGEFIGYKKVKNKIIKLKVLEDSKRSRATTDKCRCDKALVLEIQKLDGTKSDQKKATNHLYTPTTYKVGEIVYADSWDEDRWNECSHGIHFFLDRVSAVKY